MSLCSSLSAVFVLVSATPALALQTRERPVLHAVRSEHPPVIDGRLDDAVWSSAPPSDAFTQVDPREGEAPTERTEIRALLDEDTLYLAIRCFDREPAAIIGTQMRRDADLETDDRVLVVLDTFEDRRNGYLFEMNPAGARVDALIDSNGANVNTAWDAIWEGRASMDEQGWSLEMAIPFRSLGFRPGVESWGLNVQRVIKRRLEDDRWASPRRNVRAYQVSEAGALAGLSGIRQGIGLDLVPFYTAHWSREGADRSLFGQAGFDAFYRLSPGLGAALTVNTDFAETEVDQRQINLTRFPLFFPEKRDFFLQDASIFQFADLGDDLIPFFSRRIGLTDTGEEVPIEVGGKLTGRAGDYNIGVLGAHTGEAHGFDAADLFVARVSRNVGEQSSIGGIITGGDPNGRDQNALVGLDANFGTSTFRGDRNLRASVWALESYDELTDAAAFGASLSYPNDIWSWQLHAKEVEDGFHPALGFVPRTGVRSYSAELQFEPIFEGDVRRLEFGLDALAVTDLSDRLQSASLTLQFIGIVWDAGDEFRMKLIPSHEGLDQSFDIQPGVTIPTGDYDWVRWRVEAESALKRPVSGSVAFEAGDFYDGTRSDFEAAASWRPSRFFTGALSYQQNRVDLPAGSFTVHQGTMHLDAAFSPDMSWSNFLQFDNETDTLGLNSRFQWILQPGEELNFVYDCTVERDSDGVTIVSQGAVAKLQYTFRF